MSDHWLQFIPVDPEFEPTPQATQRGRELLVTFAPEADSVRAEFLSVVQFFHPGGNWSGVRCPICGADAEAWWGAAMDTAYSRQFVDLTAVASCCGTAVSLNDLRYSWPAGFARFVLAAMNPKIADLEPAQEELLREAIGCGLRKIWMHL